LEVNSWLSGEYLLKTTGLCGFASLKVLLLNPRLHCLLAIFVHWRFPLEMLSNSLPCFMQLCVERLNAASANATIQHRTISMQSLETRKNFQLPSNL
jgi:hypothetical protein